MPHRADIFHFRPLGVKWGDRVRGILHSPALALRFPSCLAPRSNGAGPSTAQRSPIRSSSAINRRPYST